MTTAKTTVSAISKIDWYSFSFKIGERETLSNYYLEIIRQELQKFCPTMVYVLDHKPTEIGNGRRPYNVSINATGFSVFASPSVEYGLVEISGAGCEILRQHGLLDSVISETSTRCTRIDLCKDFLVGDNIVKEFIDAGYSPRFKTSSDVVSSTGVTHYIGSRQSERMCRVYQYNPPHPRHENLRIEFEFKGKLAKAVSNDALSIPVDQLFYNRGEAYKFRHNLWYNNYESADLTPLTGKQSANGTLYWFHFQVVPAFERLVKEGEITDPESWLIETFLKKKKGG